MNTTKRVEYYLDHEVTTFGLPREVYAHTPGLHLRVEWTAGRATDTVEALDRAYFEIRAQIIDAKETT